MKKTTAHFWNLNEDPQLTNMIIHFLKPGSLFITIFGGRNVCKLQVTKIFCLK